MYFTVCSLPRCHPAVSSQQRRRNHRTQRQLGPMTQVPSCPDRCASSDLSYRTLEGAFTHARSDPMSPATPNPPVTQTIPCTPNAPTTSGETPMTSGRRLVARIAVTAILAYQALSVAAIIANPQWNPLTRQLSEYALGRQGWLQGAAFLASALSYAALF